MILNTRRRGSLYFIYSTLIATVDHALLVVVKFDRFLLLLFLKSVYLLIKTKVGF